MTDYSQGIEGIEPTYEQLEEEYVWMYEQLMIDEEYQEMMWEKTMEEMCPNDYARKPNP
jgi:hypothetical protein